MTAGTQALTLDLRGLLLPQDTREAEGCLKLTRGERESRPLPYDAKVAEVVGELKTEQLRFKSSFQEEWSTSPGMCPSGFFLSLEVSRTARAWIGILVAASIL